MTRRYPEDWLRGMPLELYNAVGAHAAKLQHRSLDESVRHPDIAARLARLRRAVTAEVGAIPGVWEDTVGALPKILWGDECGPSEWETAAHTAITLFALHAQSSRTAVHRKGPSMGAAARRFAGLRSNDGARPDSAVFKRFQALATATPGAELQHHLRSMITLLRTEGTQLDYGLLAVDVCWLSTIETADRVRLRWGRDFHRTQIDPDEVVDDDSESN